MNIKTNKLFILNLILLLINNKPQIKAVNQKPENHNYAKFNFYNNWGKYTIAATAIAAYSDYRFNNSKYLKKIKKFVKKNPEISTVTGVALIFFANSINKYLTTQIKQENSCSKSSKSSPLCRNKRGNLANGVNSTKNSDSNYICYANAVIQALFSIPNFDQYLNSKITNQDTECSKLAQNLLALYNTTIINGELGNAINIVETVMNNDKISFNDSCIFANKLAEKLEPLEQGLSGLEAMQANLNKYLENATIKFESTIFDSNDNNKNNCIAQVVFVNGNHYIAEIRDNNKYFQINDLSSNTLCEINSLRDIFYIRQKTNNEISQEKENLEKRRKDMEENYKNLYNELKQEKDADISDDIKKQLHEIPKTKAYIQNSIENITNEEIVFPVKWRIYLNPKDLQF